MKRLVTVAFCILLFALNASAQTEARGTSSDPEKARLVTSDIDNFWRAYDLAKKEADKETRAAIFQREYLDKGSKGLQDFARTRMKGAKELVQAIEMLPRFYASTRKSTLRIKEMEREIRASFRKLKKLYPEARFPDVYFLIGTTNTGGTASENGLLIGAELYSLTKETPREEFPGYFKAVIPNVEKDEKQLQTIVNRLLDIMLRPVEKLPPVVAHEAVHFNQDYPKLKTLLEQSLNEGAAEFLGAISAGELMTPWRNTYGDRHEAELWREFEAEMNGTNMRNWLYNGVTSGERPPDLGYYMGYKICEWYYRNAKDKRQAIRDMLTIKDFKAFLEKSGYREKFARRAAR